MARPPLARPISSARMVTARASASEPPYSWGMRRPSNPASPIAGQSSAGNVPASSADCTSGFIFSSTNRRHTAWNASCSSSRSHIVIAGLLSCSLLGSGARHTEHVLGDQVVLDLLRAAVDADRAGTEVAVEPLVHVPVHGVGTGHVEGGVLQVLLGPRPQLLGDRTLGAGKLPRHTRRQLLGHVQPQHLALDVA